VSVLPPLVWLSMRFQQEDHETYIRSVRLFVLIRTTVSSKCAADVQNFDTS